MTLTLRGVLPVLQTPYDDREQIDFEVLAAEIDWLYAQGVDGVVIAMVSEVLRLTDRERSQLVETVCRLNRGRGAVVASVGAESTYAACERARHAEGAGAAAVMAIPPISVALPEDQLRRYYSAILQSVGIGVVVQDASAYVGRPMSIPLQAALLAEFGSRVHFKPEAEPIGPRLTELREATGGQARVFEGSGGAALIDSHRRGIVGTMPGADLIDAIVALWRALEAGQSAVAAQISAALLPVLELQKTLDAYLAVEKHLLVRRGIFRNSRVRGPVGFELDDATRQTVDRRFEHLQDVLRSLAAPKS